MRAKNLRINKNGRGALIVVGGGESSEITDDSIKILEKFIELSGGAEKAQIVLMTVATDKPEEAEQTYKKVFNQLKFKNFKVVHISGREEASDKSILSKIEKATGLYFTGGDQLHVTSLLGGTPVHQLIQEKFENGLAIGGTSAGAMMMSSTVLISGMAEEPPRYDAIETSPGMNLLENAIIDTHFSQRGRHGRLLAAVAHNPHFLGLGIDERTAMIVTDGKFEVIGEGSVTVVCAKNSNHTNLPYIRPKENIGIFGVDFHILPEGYEYDLKQREPIPQTFREMMAAANEE
jgi:cyanophycinase